MHFSLLVCEEQLQAGGGHPALTPNLSSTCQPPCSQVKEGAYSKIAVVLYLLKLLDPTCRIVSGLLTTSGSSGSSHSLSELRQGHCAPFLLQNFPGNMGLMPKANLWILQSSRDWRYPVVIFLGCCLSIGGQPSWGSTSFLRGFRHRVGADTRGGVWD